ncbi:MAG TPA: hypothetical protein VI299_20275 [Polyangiales bacterium]
MSTFLTMLDPPLLPWQKPVPYSKGSEPAAYAALGMTPGAPEIWEDGLRTDPSKFSFEWWYYDAHFADGSSVVVVYYTKPMFMPGAPELPYVQVTIVTADGQAINKQFAAPPSDVGFSTEGCDLYIGPNHSSGDLEDYVLYAKIDDVEVNLDMHGLVPSWRPGSGHVFFGKGYDTRFGWLPAIPSGLTTGTMTYAGQTHAVVGSGYHDHNWGNTRLYDHEKRWWWSRGQVGPYTVIAADQRLKNRYGHDVWMPTFVVLDQNGARIDASLSNVTMKHTESNFQTHPDPNFAGSPDGKIAKTVTFRAESTNGDWAEFRIDASLLLLSQDLTPAISLGMSDLENYIAQLLHRSPWYTRFAGAAQLTFNIGGVQYQGVGGSTLELMDLE